MKMGIPMFLYILTKKDYWLKKAVLPMAIDEENINADTYEMVKASFEHVNVKAEMPSNVKMEQLKKCDAPTFIIAADKDCMFPGKKIIERVEKNLPNVKTHLLQNQGHMFKLSASEMNMIKTFIDEETRYN